MNDFNFETGWELARAWQAANGPLSPSLRLLPKRPFVLGGEYEVANLVAVPSLTAMENPGSLYQQLAQVPDGVEVTVDGWLRT